MTKQRLTVSRDWYHDGIEDGRDMWRLDLPADILQKAVFVQGRDDL